MDADASYIYINEDGEPSLLRAGQVPSKTDLKETDDVLTIVKFKSGKFIRIFDDDKTEALEIIDPSEDEEEADDE